jgi:molybdopterin molybdotransferase
MKDQITGLVLAGGLGTRMGSLNKALQPYQGKLLIEHVLDGITPQVAKVIISANRDLATFERFGHDVCQDETTGHAGPLAGLETGLRHCSTPLLLTVPCDAPQLPKDLALRLYHALEREKASVAVACTRRADGSLQAQPVFSLVRTSLLPVLSSFIASGGRRMDGWFAGMQSAMVEFDDLQAFDNINSLADLGDLHVDTVRQLIGQSIRPLDELERVDLFTALGRVLAEDIVSPINVPSHDNSAMDGYAFRHAIAEGAVHYKVVGIAYAGKPCQQAPGAGECVRIMTGAMMPPGCDTVIPQELVQSADDTLITFDAGTLTAGANRRMAGEDLQQGAIALSKGKVLRPADLGLLASLGIRAVPVVRRLRVAIFSTGDELRPIGQPLDAGSIYDSNRYTLYGMLKRLDCTVIDMGQVQDEPAALQAALNEAAELADVVITSGGVSAGAADHTRTIMQAMGEVAFWKVAMRPGRPLAFGHLRNGNRNTLLFGLPGNPVATMVSFYFFVRDALLALSGASLPLPFVQARAAADIRKRPGRTEYQRGILFTGPDGQPGVRLTGNQGSGILSSMAEANCIVILDANSHGVSAGDSVQVLPFEGLV